MNIGKINTQKRFRSVDIKRKRIFHEDEELLVLKHERDDYSTMRKFNSIPSQKPKSIPKHPKAMDLGVITEVAEEPKPSPIPYYIALGEIQTESIDFLHPARSFSFSFYAKLFTRGLKGKIFNIALKSRPRKSIPHFYSIANINFLGPRFEKGFPRKLVGVGVACTIIALLIGSVGILGKSKTTEALVKDDANEAVNYLTSGVDQLKSLNFKGASGQFALAIQKLDGAKSSLASLGSVANALMKVIPITSNSSKLIEAGSLIANAGNEFSLGFEQLAFGTKAELSTSLTRGNGDFASEPSIKIAHEHIRLALGYSREAEKILDKVNPKSLPANLSDKIYEFKTQVPELNETLSFLDSSMSFLEQIFAVDKADFKLLVLNGNTDELRASGGFMGSSVLLSFSDGRLKNYEFIDIYDPSGQGQNNIEPPEPLKRVTENFKLQDSNYYFDFERSAKIAKKFYEDSGRGSVDAIVLMNDKVVSELLATLGDVYVPEYKTTFNSENLNQKLEEEIEVKAKGSDDPKRILSYLVPEVIQKIFSSDSSSWIASSSVILKSFQEKNLMFYSPRVELQKYANDNNWSGKIRDSHKDYLAVVDTNIAGGKTNHEIERNTFYKVNIDASGSAVAELEIVYRHNGKLSGDLLGDVTYANWQRIYTPKGSELISAEGFDNTALPARDYSNFEKVAEQIEIDNTLKSNILGTTSVSEEDDKTVFGNWVFVAPSETKVVKLKYKLPFTVTPDDYYELLFQNQSGNDNVGFKGEVVFNDLKYEKHNSSLGSIKIVDNKAILEYLEKPDARFVIQFSTK